MNLPNSRKPIFLHTFIVVSLMLISFSHPIAAQLVEPPPTRVQTPALLAKPAANQDAEVLPESSEGQANEPALTFTQQLQQYYRDATETGTTTANSAAQMVADWYGSASDGASEAASSATKWVTDQYNAALEAGDTTAKSAKTWVVDDLSKIGSWEYKILRADGIDDENEKKLNELGKQRWECYAVTRLGDTSTIFYFKRPHRSYLQQLPAKDLLRLAPLLQGSSGDAQ